MLACPDSGVVSPLSLGCLVFVLPSIAEAASGVVELLVVVCCARWSGFGVHD